MSFVDPIIFFDGECHFCHSSVQFIMKRDPDGFFHFSSLQSNYGKSLLEKYELDPDLDSIVLLKDEKVYVESTAALKIARHLSGFWKYLYIFILIPAPIRNIFYRMIARNRHRWFRSKNQCLIPPPEMRNRFLS